MSSKRENTREIVLHLVREQKKILFGAFTSTLTRKVKEETWEKVRLEAISAGAKSLSEKTWQYVRDNVWSASRRDAIGKRDKRRKSGEGIVQYSTADEIVFEIIGNDAAVLDGLNVKESEDQITMEDEEEGKGSSGTDDRDLEILNPPSNKSSASTSSKIAAGIIKGGISMGSPSPLAGGNIAGTSSSRSRPHSRISKSSQESAEELDLELKRAKLDLYRKQTEGQELLNEARRLTIEKLKIEVSNSRSNSAHSSRPQSRPNLQQLGTFNYGENEYQPNWPDNNE